MKRKGQVFLNNELIMQRIVDFADLNKNDIVLEIGSGDGRLTKKLAEKAGKVYAVEVDIYLLDRSKINLKGYENVVFMNVDALEMEFPEDVNRIVSNLPYYISSPLTEKILYFMNKKRGCYAILMYQKEFGERMVAFPGLRDYSMLSVFVQYLANIEKLMGVSKSNFRPVPAVDSVVLSVKPKDISINDNFLEFCRVIFQHKKKNLYSALIDSRSKLKIKEKEALRAALSGFDEERLKKKVFYFKIYELLNTYEDMKRLGIWEKAE